MITGYTLGGTVAPPASGAALQFGGAVGLAGRRSLVALAAFWVARRIQR